MKEKQIEKQIERNQLEKEPFLTKEFLHPLAMMAASSLTLIGGCVSLMLSDKDRSNPFYFAAMTNSAIYVTANAVRAYQVHQEQVQSFQEREKARRELSGIVIEK